MSFWSNGIRASKQNLDLWKLSLALAKKHYNRVDLITDSNGYELLKDLPFSNFIKVLDDIPNYKDLWCLGKIYAYLYAANQGESFLHLDSDVFLWTKLPDDFENSKMFCQSEDFQIYKDGKKCYSYNIESIKNFLNTEIPFDWQEIINNKEELKTYNMGIFGGADLNFIKGYCDYVLDMVNNKDYNNLWNTNISISFGGNIYPHVVKSCMIEQANLGIYCKKNNIIPKLLFEKSWDENSESYKKYTHLMMSKRDPEILNRIKNRVAKEPYNLEPNNCTKEQWNTTKEPPFHFNYQV